MNKPRLLQHGRLLPALEAQLAEHFEAMADLVLDNLLAYFRSGQLKVDVPAA